LPRCKGQRQLVKVDRPGIPLHARQTPCSHGPRGGAALRWEDARKFGCHWQSTASPSVALVASSPLGPAGRQLCAVCPCSQARVVRPAASGAHGSRRVRLGSARGTFYCRTSAAGLKNPISRSSSAEMSSRVSGSPSARLGSSSSASKSSSTTVSNSSSCWPVPPTEKRAWSQVVRCCWRAEALGAARGRLQSHLRIPPSTGA
jgi:hypothetical protein